MWADGNYYSPTSPSVTSFQILQTQNLNTGCSSQSDAFSIFLCGKLAMVLRLTDSLNLAGDLNDPKSSISYLCDT